MQKYKKYKTLLHVLYVIKEIKSHKSYSNFHFNSTLRAFAELQVLFLYKQFLPWKLWNCEILIIKIWSENCLSEFRLINLLEKYKRLNYQQLGLIYVVAYGSSKLAKCSSRQKVIRKRSSALSAYNKEKSSLIKI